MSIELWLIKFRFWPLDTTPCGITRLLKRMDLSTIMYSFILQHFIQALMSILTSQHYKTYWRLSTGSLLRYIYIVVSLYIKPPLLRRKTYLIIPPLIEWGLYCNHLVCPSVCPSIHTFATDILASTGRNDFIFDIWLWHGNLYLVSPFQVYCTSTSCLQCDLEFFMFAVMKTFVTVISASTRRNDFIFDIWLWHGDLYHVSPFQVYCTSTSCLPCNLQMNEWGYS